jgi:2-amino-4-hydroxy-6-hydroxymethyldihydropteridine diphosphokinase
LVRCYVGLGSNVADSVGMVAKALACLGSQADVVLGRRSQMYASDPWGYRDQGEFVNAVCEVDTHLGPGELLARLKAIEAGLGRKQRFRWGPREIDLDILFYGDRVMAEDTIRIPHPYVCERIFVLAPLAEIVPGLVHPETGLRVSDHLKEVRCRGEELRCRNLGI